jgi:hypothetical protein
VSIMRIGLAAYACSPVRWWTGKASPTGQPPKSPWNLEHSIIGRRVVTQFGRLAAVGDTHGGLRQRWTAEPRELECVKERLRCAMR